MWNTGDISCLCCQGRHGRFGSRPVAGPISTSTFGLGSTATKLPARSWLRSASRWGKRCAWLPELRARSGRGLARTPGSFDRAAERGHALELNLELSTCRRGPGRPSNGRNRAFCRRRLGRRDRAAAQDHCRAAERLPGGDRRGGAHFAAKPGPPARSPECEGSLCASNAQEGQALEPGRLYVAPPDKHLIVEPPDRLRLGQGPKENRFRPAVDPLFRSAALAYGGRVAGIVLSAD